jgi:hypothetical protein
MIIPEELRLMIVPRSEPASLAGTQAQVAYAATIRRSMLAVARRYGPPELVDMFMGVRDSTWFIANRNRPLDQLRWPSPSQMIAPETREPTDGDPPRDAVGCPIGFEKVGAATPPKVATPLTDPGNSAEDRSRGYLSIASTR